jgi:putative aldouronate transport system substrate-binding protein
MKDLGRKVLVIALCGISLTVCSKGTFVARSSDGAGADSAGGDYPIKTDVTLTYWKELNGTVSPNFTSLNDTEFARYVQEETGIKVNFISPAVGGGRDAFNLLVASGNMPDIIEYGWNRLPGYPGGPAAALKNNVIIPLNDLLDTYAPDLKGLFEENSNYDKMVKTDDGTYYIFPVMKLDDYLNTTYGLFVRKDWLDELNMQIPVTIDDWYNVLSAFKNEKGASYTFTFHRNTSIGSAFNPFSNGMFTGAYGFTKGWFLNNGKVAYGAYEIAYKDWLKTMAKWYAEGLIDNNFATNDGSTVDSNILNGLAGACALQIGGGLGRYLPQLRAEDPNISMVAAPYPVLKSGDEPQFSSLLNAFDGGGACITATSKNPEYAARFLNYGYTEKGRKTWNYGREGISYIVTNGVVNLTESVTRSPEGWPLSQAWSKYSHGVYPGPFFSERRFLELYYPYPEQVDALGIFTSTNMKSHLMPPVSPTPDESSDFARIMTNILAYEDEYTLTAIMGTVNIDASFNEYREQLKRLGIDRAIEIQQGALERYNSR